MGQSLPPGYVLPTPQPPKTIGVLNVVFGAILIVLSLFTLAMQAFMPFYGKVMVAQQNQVTQQALGTFEANQKAELADVETREKSAKTPEEKAALAAERDAIQRRPKPFVPDMTVGFKIARHPAMVVYSWSDVATGLPLNIVMLVAGIGLINLKRWGRTLALWVAGLKLVRIAILLAASVMIVSPLATREIDKLFGDMVKQAQRQNPASSARVQQTLRTMSVVVGATMTGGYIVYFVLAAIYPMITLRVLSKPGVRAAFIAKQKVSEGEAAWSNP